MKARYQMISTDAVDSKVQSKKPAAFLARDRRLLLMLDLIKRAQCAIGETVDVMRRATIEVVLPIWDEQRTQASPDGF